MALTIRKVIGMLWVRTEAGPKEDLVHHLCYLPYAKCIRSSVAGGRAAVLDRWESSGPGHLAVL